MIHTAGAPSTVLPRSCRSPKNTMIFISKGKMGGTKIPTRTDTAVKVSLLARDNILDGRQLVMEKAYFSAKEYVLWYVPQFSPLLNPFSI